HRRPRDPSCRQTCGRGCRWCRCNARSNPPFGIPVSLFGHRHGPPRFTRRPSWSRPARLWAEAGKRAACRYDSISGAVHDDLVQSPSGQVEARSEPVMQTRELGQTGLRVTRLGLGLAALGRPGYINLGHADDLGHDHDRQAMQRHAHAVLDAAWNTGVCYFDTARSYGDGERFLASWLAARGVSPTEVVVASKW